MEFSLLFSKNHDKPLRPLMDEIQDGSLVDIKVDKNSLKLKLLPGKYILMFLFIWIGLNKIVLWAPFLTFSILW